MYNCIRSVTLMLRSILTICLPNRFFINHVRWALGLGCCSPYSAMPDPRIHVPKINLDQVLQHCHGQRPALTGLQARLCKTWEPGTGEEQVCSRSLEPHPNLLIMTASEGRPPLRPSGLSVP